MTISAAMVKTLRERTGAGMMECKKALSAADGNMEAAVEQMRISGLAKADRKSDNTAAEGAVVIQIGAAGKRFAMTEINSQTDFASKSEDFNRFADRVTAHILAEQPAALDDITIEGESLDTLRKTLVAKIGENIQVRRFAAGSSDALCVSYSHDGRIGVVVEIENGDEKLGRDIAMHIAASKPVCLDEAQVPAELLEKEKAILVAEAAESGKPAEIIEKMVQGRMKKYLAEVTLLGQPFVKDPDQSVAELLKSAGATVRAFHRFEVGEGIEKKEENFRDEVMAQVRATEDKNDEDKND